MRSFIEFTIGSFAALFPVADPLGAVPIFLVLSAGVNKQNRETMALKIAIYMILVLTTFLFIGGSLLSFFGLSIAVVKVAGGIVVFEAGWEALKEEPKLKEKDEKLVSEQIENQEDITFIPMTIPMLAGPGSIAVTLGLAAQAGKTFSFTTGLNFLAIITAISFIAILSYICLRLSSSFLQLFGENGITAISRLLGLFILAIGVQLILNGLADWVRDFLSTHDLSALFRFGLS